jgi:hypothetical protein
VAGSLPARGRPVQGRCRVGRPGRAGSPRSGCLAAGRRLWSRAREPIFSETHTKEFRGVGKSTPEAAGACRPLCPGRWVYEKGAGRAAAGRRHSGNYLVVSVVGLRGPARGMAASKSSSSAARPHMWCGCELASPFLAKPIQMSFAGLGNPPQSPPARAPHCALVGGYVRKEEKAPAGRMSRVSLAEDSAPPRGSLRRPLLVPFHTSPPSRGALRSAGVPTIAASTTSAPLLPPARLRPACARHLGRLCRRKGIPHVRRGVGYVGAWRFARPVQSHRGYLPVGDASGLNLPVGPPLGALRR